MFFSHASYEEKSHHKPSECFETISIWRFIFSKHRSLLLIGCCVMICDFVTASGNADDSRLLGYYAVFSIENLSVIRLEVYAKRVQLLTNFVFFRNLQEVRS